MPFTKITTKSLALSSVTSDTILNNTIKYEDLSSDVSSAIQNTRTVVQSNSASWGMGGGNGAGIISKTYAELKALKDANQLVAGQYYKITDFQLKWWNQSINDNTVKTSAFIEPLNILAISVNKFSNIAYSDLYPTDTIYYDFEATKSTTWGSNNISNQGNIPDFKGWIFRRIDPEKDININYDWRHITVNCCRPDLSQITSWNSTLTANKFDVVKLNNKLYFSTVDNNIGISPPNISYWQHVSDFNEGLTYFPTDETDSIITLVKPFSGVPIDVNNFSGFFTLNQAEIMLDVKPLTSTRVQKYTFNDSAESIGNRAFAAVSVSYNGHSNLFCGYTGYMNLGDSCFLNIFGMANRDFYARSNYIKNIVGFYNQSIIAGSSIIGNIISNACESLTLGNYINVNIFSDQSTNNIFGDRISYNIFGPRLRYNKFGSIAWMNFIKYSFQSNQIGDVFCGNSIPASSNGNVLIGGFYGNTIKGSFWSNTIGVNCNKNIMNWFEKNTIQQEFQENTMLYYFASNNVGTSFIGNVFNSFYYNNIEETFVGNHGNDFSYNNIGKRCGCNNFGISTSLNFQYNTIESNTLFGCQGSPPPTNFTNATHVFNPYHTRIFLTGDTWPGNYRRLSFIYPWGLQIVNITD